MSNSTDVELEAYLENLNGGSGRPPDPSAGDGEVFTVAVVLKPGADDEWVDGVAVRYPKGKPFGKAGVWKAMQDAYDAAQPFSGVGLELALSGTCHALWRWFQKHRSKVAKVGEVPKRLEVLTPVYGEMHRIYGIDGWRVDEEPLIKELDDGAFRVVLVNDVTDERLVFRVVHGKVTSRRVRPL